jgi:GntR family transcriptional regulator
LYHQIKEYVLDKIESREWKTGQAIPSEVELSSLFNVSRATVRQALLELVNAGYLHRMQGIGTVVTEPKVEPIAALTSYSENMRSCGIVPGYKTLDLKWVRETDGIPHQIVGKSQSSDLFLSIRRILLANGEPLSLQQTFIPKWVVEGNEDLFTKERLDTESLYGLLKNKCGVSLFRASESLHAAMASPEEADLLGLSGPCPVLVIQRHTYDRMEQLVEYVSMVFRADRYSYKISLFSSESR